MRSTPARPAPAPGDQAVMSTSRPTSGGVAAFTGALESVSLALSESPDVGFGGGRGGGAAVGGSAIELTEVMLIWAVSIVDRDHPNISTFYRR